MQPTKRRPTAGNRKPPPVTLPGPTWDKGATGQANQARMQTEPATDIDPESGNETPNPNRVTRRRRISFVDTYRKQGIITHAQAAAAATLRMASEGMKERDPIASIGETRTPGGSDPEAARLDSRKYYRELWARIPQLSQPVVQRVVLDDLAIKDGNTFQRERYFLRLRAGLDAIS